MDEEIVKKWLRVMRANPNASPDLLESLATENGELAELEEAVMRNTPPALESVPVAREAAAAVEGEPEHADKE